MHNVFMIVILFSLLTTELFSRVRTDIVDSVAILKTKDVGSRINVYFKIATHRGMADKRYSLDKNRHKCILFDKKGHKIAFAQGERDIVYLHVDRKLHPKIWAATLVCKSKIQGERYSNQQDYFSEEPKVSTSLAHVKAKNHSPTVALVRKSPQEIEADNVKLYSKAPNIFFDDLHIFNIQKISYRNSKKNSVMVEASSGNYVLPLSKLKQAQFANLSIELKQQLEGMME